MAGPAPTVPDDQKDKLNPGNTNYEKLVDTKSGSITNNPSAADIDRAESRGDNPAGRDDQSVSDGEANPTGAAQRGFFKPSEDGKGFKQKQSLSVRLRGWAGNRKSPAILIILAVLGLGGLGSAILLPGIGIVHMKETLVSDLNDQLTALDERMDHVFRAKFKGMTAPGICSNGIKVHCQFTSMSDRQVEKFRRAGFEVETDPQKTAFGRNRIAALRFTSGGRTITITDPQDLINGRRQFPELRKALNRVFNPAFAGFSDKVANSVFKNRFKTSKAPKITATDPEEINRQVAEHLNRQVLLENGQRVIVDEDGTYSVVDEDGRPVVVDEATAKQLEAERASITGMAETAAETGTKAVGNVLRGVLITGALDAGCTVYNTARGVAAAAKAIRAIQLGQFAMVFLNTADAIKASDATQEAVAYIGNQLNATDVDRQVVDINNPGGALVDNPYYGQSAFDSPGYKVAAYNEAAILTPRDQQYMVGGGLAGDMSNVIAEITAVAGGSQAVNDFCKVVQNPVVRVLSAGIGIVAAIGSFSLSTVAMTVGSVAIGFALPFLQAMLADIMAGTVVSAATKGIDAGDANFVGTSVLLGGIAQASGMKPATDADLQEYAMETSRIKSEYIAQAKYEAKDTPFDVMNQYSFLGSLARSVYPIAIKAASSVSGFLASIPHLLMSPFTATNANVMAFTYNGERFNNCPDRAYAELGIAADVFCNVRYGLSSAELSMDSEVVVNYMLTAGQIDGDGIAIKGSRYETFLTNCVERTDGWGEATEEGGSTGNECMTVSDEYSNFRIYTMDKRINDAMDEGV